MLRRSSAACRHQGLNYLAENPPSSRKNVSYEGSPEPRPFSFRTRLSFWRDARPRLAIGTECSAVVLGVKVRQEPSSVSLHPPKPRPRRGAFLLRPLSTPPGGP